MGEGYAGCPPRARNPRKERLTDPFDLSHAPGRAPEMLAPGLRVVTAPNGGPMTSTGTRSYIVGAGEVAVIDPGPDDPRHLEALAAALAASGSRRCSSPMRTAITARARAPSRAAWARRCSRMATGGRALAGDGRAWAAGALGRGEGIDAGFRPDRRIGEGASVAGPGWTLTALATPGHTGDSLSFAWVEGGALFPATSSWAGRRR